MRRNFSFLYELTFAGSTVSKTFKETHDRELCWLNTKLLISGKGHFEQ